MLTKQLQQGIHTLLSSRAVKLSRIILLCMLGRPGKPKRWEVSRNLSDVLSQLHRLFLHQYILNVLVPSVGV